MATQVSADIRGFPDASTGSRVRTSVRLCTDPDVACWRHEPVVDSVLPRMSVRGTAPYASGMDEGRVEDRIARVAVDEETAAADHRSAEHRSSRGGAPPITSVGSEPALRDATAIAERIAMDEASAAAARLRLRDAPPSAIEADGAIGPLLEPGELLVACRRSVGFDRRQLLAAPDRVSPFLAGDLYLTSRRLVLIGRVTLSFDLAAVEEVIVSAERILLVGRDGTGVALDVHRPRTLRVEIAAARAALRA